MLLTCRFLLFLAQNTCYRIYIFIHKPSQKTGPVLFALYPLLFYFCLHFCICLIILVLLKNELLPVRLWILLNLSRSVELDKVVSIFA